MTTPIWVNIGSGNGLLPDSTKPLPEPMLTYHQWGPMKITWGKFHKRYFRHKSLKIAWKLRYLKFHANLPGANELNSVVTYLPQLAAWPACDWESVASPCGCRDTRVVCTAHQTYMSGANTDTWNRTCSWENSCKQKSKTYSFFST